MKSLKKLLCMLLAIIMIVEVVPMWSVAEAIDNVIELEQTEIEESEEEQEQETAQEDDDVVNEEILTPETNAEENEADTTEDEITVIDSGNCGAEGDGSNLTWTLTSDGTLTISGKGKMKDYFYSAPWSSYGNRLKKLMIGNGVTTIGDYAFNECKGFTGNLEIPDSVTTIGAYAFNECKGFTGNLEIPDSVTTIGAYAFNGCEGFTGSLTISQGITSIVDRVFSGCKGLTGSLIIPNSVTTIGEYAFSSCSGFTGDLEIPSSVTAIGYQAFGGCKGFTGNLTISNGVISIGKYAFEDCKGFTGVLTISSSVNEIGVGAFAGSSNFYRIIVEDTNKYFFTNAGGNMLMENSKDGISIIRGLNGKGDLIIPYGVTSIREYAFGSCKEFTGCLVLPNTLTEIYAYAFSFCNFTGELLLPDSLIYIGQGAFSYCTGLTGALRIPDNVRKIDTEAFEGCGGFSGELKISNSCKYIGYEAFSKCRGFTGKLVIPGSIEDIVSGAFSDCIKIDAICFMGNAPKMTRKDILLTFPSDKTLYYREGTTGWTTPTWNGYKTAVWSPDIDDIPTENGKYTICVVDNDTSLPIEGAQVFFDGNTILTNQKGHATTDGKFSRLEITVPDYESISYKEYSMRSVGYDIITMSKKAGALHSAVMKYNGAKFNLLSECKTVNAELKDTEITITCDECYSMYEIAYQLIQIKYEYNDDGTLIYSTNIVAKSSDGIFTVKLGDFEPGVGVYVRKIKSDGKSGSLLGDTLIGLKVIKKTAPKSSYISLGDKVSFKVGDGVPVFGGMQMDVSIPLIPVTYELSDDKMKVSFNCDGDKFVAEKKNAKWLSGIENPKGFENRDIAKEINEYCEKIGSPEQRFVNAGKFALNGRIFGYAEGNLDGSQIKGKLYIMIKMDYSTEFPFMVGPVPLVLAIDVNGSVGVGGDVKIQFDPVKTYVNISVDAEMGLKAHLGAGIAKVASAGAYGSGKTNWKFLLASDEDTPRGLYEATISAEAGAEVRLLGRSLTKLKIYDGGPWIIYKRDIEEINSVGTAEAMYVTNEEEEESGKAITLEEALVELMDSNKVYDSIALPEAAAEEIADDGFTYIEKNCYNGARPYIAVADGVTMAVYTGADTSRAAADASCLMYSIYDSATGTWSIPSAVANDGTADFSPSIYTSENIVYVIWQNAVQKLDEGLTLSQIGAATELYAAKYEVKSGKWEMIGAVRSCDGVYRGLPKIAVINGDMYATWTVNDKNDVFGIEGSNKVCYATYKNGQFGGVNEIPCGENAIIGIDIGLMDGKPAILYSVDTDKNFISSDDVKVYGKYINDASNEVVIATAASDAKFANIAGKDKAVWYKNGAIYGIDSIGADAEHIVDAEIYNGTFATCGNMSNSAILYTVASSEEIKNSIYAVLFDAQQQSWGRPIEILTQNAYLEDISAGYNGSNLIVAGIKRLVSLTDDGKEQSDIFYTVKQSAGYPVIENVTYADTEILVPGEKLTLQVSTANYGTSYVENMHITVKNAAQNVLFDDNVNVKLFPGNKKTVYIDVTLPKAASSDVYIVTNEYSTANVEIGLAELTMEQVKYSAAGKNFLAIKVTNEGFETASGKIQISDYDDGTKYFSKVFNGIKYMKSFQAVFEIKDSLFKNGEDKIQLNIDIVSDKKTRNNILPSDSVVLYKPKVAHTLQKIKADISGAKTLFYENEEFSSEGVMIWAEYSDGYSEDVTGYCSFAGYDRTVGEKNIIVKFIKDDIALAETSYNVTVKSKVVPGDINDDGKVDIRDAIRLAKYLAKENVEINLSNANVNGDDKVDVRDLIRLKKYLAKMPVELI